MYICAYWFIQHVNVIKLCKKRSIDLIIEFCLYHLFRHYYVIQSESADVGIGFAKVNNQVLLRTER